MDRAENGRWIIPSKKFGMVRVKLALNSVTNECIPTKVRPGTLYFVVCK